MAKANILVEIAGRSIKLNSTLAKANKRVNDFSKKASQKLGQITKKAAIAVTAATGIITAAFVKTANEIDKLAKVSSKLGIPIEALQRLNFQAKLAGVSSEQFNVALQRMVRRVAEAAMGTGEAAGALQELGIDAKRLVNLSADKQFEIIADALSKIPTQGEKVRKTFKFFDTEGVALVNLFNGSLSKTGEEYKKLGTTISTEQSKQIEKFNDLKTTVGEVFNGILKFTTVALTPAFKRIVEITKEWLDNMGGAENVAKILAKAIVDLADVGVQAFKGLLNTVDGIRIGFNGAILAAIQLTKILKGIANAASKIPLPGPAGAAFKTASDLTLPSNRTLDDAGVTAARSIDEARSRINSRNSTESIFAKLRERLGKESSNLASQISPIDINTLTTKGGGSANQRSFGSITDASGRTLRLGDTKSQSGVASITDAETGRTKTINLNINADKEKLVKAVINSTDFTEAVRQGVSINTNNAARNVDR